MIRTGNPFRYSGDLGAKDLVDRVQESALVESTIRDGQKLFLIGPRRYGKTSILHAVEENMARSGAIVLRFNAEAYPSLDMLVEKIVALAVAHMRNKLKMNVTQFAHFFSRLRPEFTFNAIEQAVSVRLGVDVTSARFRPVKALTDALDGLESLAKGCPDSVPVGLILDEFQAVVERGGRTAEAQIRAAIQEHHRVGYVFAGSQTRLLTDMTMNHDRPLYRLGANKFIGPLPPMEFEKYLSAQFLKSGFSVKDETPIKLILELAEEVPYNAQMLAHHCWEALRSASGTKAAALSPTLVRKVLEDTVRGLDPLFTQTWTGLTPNQQKALLGVVLRGGRGMTSSETAKSFNIPVASLQTAVDSLRNQSILRDEPADGAVRIRFEDPFFAHWIKLTVLG